MKSNCNVEVITLSSIRYYKGYMPIGVLTNEDGDEVGYLAPFRAYSFQVSATFDGHSDLGSTQVFGLNNLLDARFGTERNLGYQSNLKMDTVKVYLLKLAAKEAIANFCEKTWALTQEYGTECYRVFKDTPCESYLGDGKKLPFLWGSTMLDRFVGLCVKWLSPSLYETYTDDCDIEKESAETSRFFEDYIVKDIAKGDAEAAQRHQKRIDDLKADIESLNAMNATMKEVR